MTRSLNRAGAAGACRASIIERLAPQKFAAALPDLADLLIATVDAGSPLGFIKPLGRDQARDYWLSVRAQVEAQSRVLVVARTGERGQDAIVGAGQLALSPWGNSQHRAELQKLCVAPAFRGRGIGKRLIRALHDEARERGRCLLTLSTRYGEAAELLYRDMGYKEAGVIPGWTKGPAGERYAHVTLYCELV